MEDEVIITGFEPKVTKFEFRTGEWRTDYTYLLEKYEINHALTHKPEFLEVRYNRLIQLIVQIDQSKSDFESGQIIPEGDGNKVEAR